MKPRFKADRVELAAVGVDELAWQGAAYVLTENAYVVVGASGRSRTVVLWPKPGVSLKELAADFENEYKNQVLRWKLLKLNKKVAAAALARALETASPAEQPAGAASASLSDGHRREIEQALAEAAAEPWDPLGIAKHWEDLKGKTS